MNRSAKRRDLIIRLLVGLALVLFIAAEVHAQLPRPVNAARCGSFMRSTGGGFMATYPPGQLAMGPFPPTGMGQSRTFNAAGLYNNCGYLGATGPWSMFVPCTMTAAGTMTRVADVAPAFLSNAMCTAMTTIGGFTGNCTHTAGQPTVARGNLRARRFCAGIPNINPGVMTMNMTVASLCPTVNTITGFPNGGAVVSTVCYDLMPVELMEFSISSEALPVELME